MKEFSQPSVQKSEVDINRAIEGAVTISCSQYRDIAEIELALDPDVSKLKCVSSQINQAVLNMLSNAVEAVEHHCQPGQGRIRIETKMRANSVELRIEDNGGGIPNEIRHRIFDPFFTTKEVGKGTGQGLSFVYDVIVNKHDGAIHAQSLPNGGTTFVVSLPLLDSCSSSRRKHANSIH